MERLTDDKIYTFDNHLDKCESAWVVKVQKKLKEYEDLEEQGLLEIFICNTGDIVYYVRSTFEKPMEFMIERIEVYEDEIIYVDADNNEWFKDDFGKTVFLTKEEAEQKLESMQKE